MSFSHTPRLQGRRRFLKGLAGAGVVTIVSGGASVGRGLTAWATPGAGDDPVVVSIFLRGAADGLNIVCPHGDPNYYAQRGSYALDGAEFNDLDGFFGLHSVFSPLMQHWQDGRLGFVQAVGSPEPSRSHFVAQPNMETGLATGGWMQRAIASSSFANGSAGVSLGDRTSPQLAGPWSGAVVDTIGNAVASGERLELIRPTIGAMYVGSGARPLEAGAVASALTTIDQLSGLDPMPGSFPNTGIGVDLREAATLIRGDYGVRCVAIELSGWDHHSEGLPRMEERGAVLSAAIAAFMDDLQEARGRVILVVSSEFGRTVRANGSDGEAGTDHGRGNMMLVMGDPLIGQGGGQVLTPGGWPGLAEAQIDNNALKVTTDFRSVYAEVAERHLGVPDGGAIFPGLERQDVGLLGTRGDVNYDGNADIVDAMLVAQYDAGIRDDGGATNQFNGSIHAKNGDINGDDSTNVVDSLLIAQCDAGITNGYCS